MKYYSLLISLFFCLLAPFADGTEKPKTTIKGKIVEARSQQAIEFASVLLIDKTTRKTVAGITSSADGRFTLVTEKKNFFIEIRFMGFVSQQFENFSIRDNTIDLGVISLKEDSKMLQGVVVEGQKSQTEFKLDRRVFNVGSDLSISGASALEVLDNVPAVDVNIQGQVSLRGSTGVNILINGKPSVLSGNEGGNALGTITAD
ncbi:MAG: carboxypeptidase-like regulatory domain-containing protein, partial [Cytophagales bacterium]|nr:carboxypeptidase-like regulatory domain-containing protein [Cytophagales bacterium]